jgi:hypothetical protein
MCRLGLPHCKLIMPPVLPVANSWFDGLSFGHMILAKVARVISEVAQSMTA